MTIEQIDELIERLENNLEFAKANIYEVPIDLPDNLDLAISGLQELKQWTKLLSIEEKDCSPKLNLEELRMI